MDVRQISTRELQSNLTLKENKNVKCNLNPLVLVPFQTAKPILRILSIYGYIFQGYNFSKQCHALNTIFQSLLSYTITYFPQNTL